MDDDNGLASCHENDVFSNSCDSGEVVRPGEWFLSPDVLPYIKPVRTTRCLYQTEHQAAFTNPWLIQEVELVREALDDVEAAAVVAAVTQKSSHGGMDHLDHLDDDTDDTDDTGNTGVERPNGRPRRPRSRKHGTRALVNADGMYCTNGALGPEEGSGGPGCQSPGYWYCPQPQEP
jgi:hypothetical protein